MIIRNFQNWQCARPQKQIHKSSHRFIVFWAKNYKGLLFFEIENYILISELPQLVEFQVPNRNTHNKLWFVHKLEGFPAILNTKYRDGGTTGTRGGGVCPLDFGRSINSTSTMGADYVHHIVTRPSGFSDLPPSLKWVSKFVYFEKATKFFEIFTLLLSTVHTDKSKVKILQNFVAFSDYMNFNWNRLTWF